MLQIAGNRPIPGVLFGITHQADGSPIIRESKVLKVGIGIPKGRGLNVFIRNDGRWYFTIARKEGGKVVEKTIEKGLGSRKEAEDFYRQYYKTAEVVNRPRKLGYFTFTRPVPQQDGSEVFEPDWDAIEAHGPTPREIDIVFLDDSPFDGAYQMWSTSQLQCRGDGMVAQRVLELAANDQEKELARQAKENGERYFPIIGGCWTNGCSYSKPVVKGDKEYPSPCKPGGDLKFQLANNIRVGGTAYYHTTGFRSISQIFSSLERIKALTNGRVAGIPLKMVLRPYRTKHNGQTATQYGVSIEFRAQDIGSVQRNLIQQAWKFRELAGVTAGPSARVNLLEAPADRTMDDDSPITAQAITDEFHSEPYDDYEDDDPAVEAATAPVGAAAATNAKTQELAERLGKKRKPPEEEPKQQAAPVEVSKDEEYRDAPPEDPEDPRFNRKQGDMF